MSSLDVSDPRRPAASRVVHLVDEWSSQAVAACTVSAVVVVSVVLLIGSGFPEVWTNAFWTACAGATVVMTFVIQHTQRRMQTATQLKLDELLRAAPEADDHLVHIESGADSEMHDHNQRLLQHREATIRNTESADGD